MGSLYKRRSHTLLVQVRNLKKIIKTKILFSAHNLIQPGWINPLRFPSKYNYIYFFNNIKIIVSPNLPCPDYLEVV
jgi:hypothetical protein